MWKYFVDQDGYVWTINVSENITPYPCAQFTFTNHDEYNGIELWDDEGFLIDEFVLHDSLLELAKIIEA